jgi:hypothetical protein
MSVGEKGEPMSFVWIYVDDGGFIRTPEAIKELIEALGNTFKVNYMGEMDKFVGCHIINTPDKDGVWIHQPKLLKNLKIKFEEILEDAAIVFKTPSATKTLIFWPKEGDPLISPEKQKQFQMGVVVLLFLSSTRFQISPIQSESYQR